MNLLSHASFADALTPCRDARYVIFGVPFDSTTSFRAGTRAGPRAIREFSYNFESYVPAYRIDMSDIPIADIGDLDVSTVPDLMAEEVEGAVRDVIKAGKVPILLGGEHSITAASARAVRPDCFIVCDAHLDLREEFRGTVHNHACTTREVYEGVTRDVIIIGGRSGTADQFAFAEEHLTLFTSDHIRNVGMEQVLSELQKRIAGKNIYLSIDADVIDSCLTPGLGTPEPFGLTPDEIRSVVGLVAPRAIAFDYTEVCPEYDHGQAAVVAGQLIREFIAANWISGRHP